jgi:ABC-2 type transport system ATP-binding protein
LPATAVSGDTITLADVAVQLSQAGVRAEDVTLRRPTLDDVFLRLTGRTPEDQATARPDAEEVAA